MYELLKLVEFGEARVAQGRRLALATLIRTSGSAYRKAGVQMIVADDLTYEGAISGGCVEKEVLHQSGKVFREGTNVIFDYDGRFKLGCNGKIDILIELLRAETFQSLSAKIQEYHRLRKPLTLVVNKDRQLTSATSSYSFGSDKVAVTVPDPKVSYDDSQEFPILPQPQLVILGGEYDSVTLARLADMSGFLVHLVVKETFTHTLTPSVKVAFLNPDQLKSVISFDDRTAVVLMTHSLSKDLSFLSEVAPLPSRYIGMLGPKARRDDILNQLMSRNESLFLEHQEKLGRIHGPVGLPIGGKTPEEISISILAEVVAEFNKSA
jgi:xanthine/CO dehydrogenase XdhC/CoxF family maturation factor